MRELAVQAANETNTDDDKESIQDEIESLKKEMDCVLTDTEFNTRHYLTEVSIPECMGIMFREFPYQICRSKKRKIQFTIDEVANIAAVLQ